MKAQIYIVTNKVTSIYKDSSYYNPSIPLIDKHQLKNKMKYVL